MRDGVKLRSVPLHRLQRGWERLGWGEDNPSLLALSRLRGVSHKITKHRTQKIAAYSVLHSRRKHSHSKGDHAMTNNNFNIWNTTAIGTIDEVHLTESQPPSEDSKVETIADAVDESDAPFGKRDATPEKIGIDVLDSFLEQIEKIPFDKIECRGKRQIPYYIYSIDHLFETAKGLGLDIGKRNKVPHFFNGRFSERIDMETFQHFLQIVGMKQGIPYGIIKDHAFVKKLMKQFASEARFPILPEDDTPKINLRNGTLHFTPSGIELKPFDKQDGLCYQLGYDYDEDAESPLFKKFIDRVQPDKAMRKLLFQYVGYVFLPTMKLEKILFLYGGGDNGKSVFLDVVQALIGKEQCCAYSIAGLTKSEYQRAEFGNYLLNTCHEISSRIGGTDILKKIASRQPLQARYIRERSFIIKNYATSIFAMNELPRDTEQTRAFFRRFLIVPFDVIISEEEKDTELAQKIIRSEMSGVLNYVVKGARSLLKSGNFDIPPLAQNAVEEFRKESDSVLMFLEENGYRPSSERWKTLREMYDSYKEQCKDDGSVAVGKRAFSKRLRTLGFKVVPFGRKKMTVVYAKRVDDAESAER